MNLAYIILGFSVGYLSASVCLWINDKLNKQRDEEE